MSPEALSELIFNIANNLVNEGKAGTLTTDLIPPQAKFAVMRPKDRAHGDWASNAAMQLAKKAGMKPHDFAELFAAELANADGIKSVEVAGPGFINIVLDSASAAAVVDTVLNEGANYGKNDHLSGKTLNLEFVSANPTGPIHIGGTRWAAVGDSMARVLEANGAKVVREYYFNDHGEQINRFAKSLVAAAHGEEPRSTVTRALISMRSHVASSMRQKPTVLRFSTCRASTVALTTMAIRWVRAIPNSVRIPQACSADDVRRNPQIHEGFPCEFRRVVP